MNRSSRSTTPNPSNKGRHPFYTSVSAVSNPTAGKGVYLLSAYRTRFTDAIGFLEAEDLGARSRTKAGTLDPVSSSAA